MPFIACLPACRRQTDGTAHDHSPFDPHLSKNQCRACFVAFSSPAELRAHSEKFRRKLLVLTAKIQTIMYLADDDEAEKDVNVCPFCDEYFELQEELDDHIWAHQSEVCELSEKIKAACWHLPLIDNGAENTHTHDATPDKYGRGASSRCPYPRCETSMAGNSQLKRHYGTHITCHEICVGCRKQLFHAAAYQTHQDCSLVKGDAAKASFVRHRATQLSTLVSQNFEGITRKRTLNGTQRKNKAKRQRGPIIAREPQPDPAPDVAPDVAPDAAPDPDPDQGRDPNLATYTGLDHSLVDWNPSVQMFPTPPSSGRGVDAAQNPLLSDACPQTTFPQWVGLIDPGGSLTADIFDGGYTIPVYPPTTAVYPGSSVSNVVDELEPRDDSQGYLMS